MAGDWPDLRERLTNLGAIAEVVEAAPLDPDTRRLTLTRIARDATEAAELALGLAAQTSNGGDDWWHKDAQTW
ncbi:MULTISPECIES: hypothetical protein [unclassified Streptomyces]|uniref:hypothetical protein n=1 Tax=unclassified Streptomyces TaxID=2593676 RepID=UPI0013C80DEB|nr:MULTISPECIES: hypothetical protein [unclassified Streptomyces]MDF9815210.1 hypothetical protein [Streptomyces sp. SPB162]NEA77218.1 hypothetical protein [Streptomyces sp. SID13588]